MSRKPQIKIKYLLILTLMSGVFANTSTAEVLMDENGWTHIIPSEDSQFVYVSSSEGDDSNDGLSPETPKKTIQFANYVLRDNHPDWLLLKRGDTFESTKLRRWKNGRNADEPIVMTYYGNEGPRPVIKLTSQFIDWDGEGRNHIALIGLDFYRSISDPNSPDFTSTGSASGLRFVSIYSNSTNLLIEDCVFRYCSLLLQGAPPNYIIENAKIRRNSVLNCWSPGSTEGGVGSQGMFAHGVVNFTLEENLFHHNGWNEEIEGAGANQYNHNVYLQKSLDGEILVRGNILSYGSAHGVQLRSGGTAVKNAFVGNSVGMNIGYSSYPDYYTGETVVNDNVFTDGRPQIPDDSSNPQTGAIWGLWKQLINDVSMNGNIVANIKDSRGSSPSPYKSLGANEFGSGNIAWNWVNDNDPASNPGWQAPTRNADSYAVGLGYTDWNDFIDAASTRHPGEMPAELTAYSYINYIREGFNKSPVDSTYSSGAFNEYLGATLSISPTDNGGAHLSVFAYEELQTKIELSTNLIDWQEVSDIEVTRGQSKDEALDSTTQDEPRYYRLKTP